MHHPPLFTARSTSGARHEPQRLLVRVRPASLLILPSAAELAPNAIAHHLLAYSPARPVTMNGWASRALPGRGHLCQADQRGPGPDLRAIRSSSAPTRPPAWSARMLTADRNRSTLRLRMSDETARTEPGGRRPAVSSSPTADKTWPRRGSSRAHLVKRFVESCVPDISHLEDHRPGTKKCCHHGVTGLVPSGRTYQSPQHRPLPTRHHAGARHHIVAAPRRRAANLLDSRATARQPSCWHHEPQSVYKSCPFPGDGRPF